jgi:hypothetical protein
VPAERVGWHGCVDIEQAGLTAVALDQMWRWPRMVPATIGDNSALDYADFSVTGSPRCLSLGVVARIQGFGILLPRYQYRVMGTVAILKNSIPSAAAGLRHRPVWSIRRRRTSLHFQRCSFIHQRMTLHHAKVSRAWMVSRGQPKITTLMYLRW